MDDIEQTTDSQIKPTFEKLVTAELDGKLKAIAGYDEIIWKIRAGYLGILYGSLALILGTEGVDDLGATISEPTRMLTLVLLVAGFSLSAYIVDSTYLAKKLKVIAIRDLLVKLAIDNSIGTMADLTVLLSISGELQEHELPDQARRDFRKIYSANRYRELFPIYGTAPILMICLYLIVSMVSAGG
jgi:hypothetical protein